MKMKMMMAYSPSERVSPLRILASSCPGSLQNAAGGKALLGALGRSSVARGTLLGRPRGALVGAAGSLARAADGQA